MSAEKYPALEDFVVRPLSWASLDHTGQTVYKIESYRPNLRPFRDENGDILDNLNLIVTLKKQGGPSLQYYCSGYSAEEIKDLFDGAAGQSVFLRVFGKKVTSRGRGAWSQSLVIM